MELKPGTLLERGKYRIICTLGRGGFGITYLAEQTLAGRNVCIKEFFPKNYYTRSEETTQLTLSSDGFGELMDRFKTKFYKEAQTIAQLDHPNIVHIHDVFEENNTVYYAMDYIEGGTLNNLVKQRGALNEALATKYITQIAAALEHIHERKIMHLDVKPANIIVSNDGNNVVLIDFGLAKHYNEHSGEATSTTPVGVSHGYAPLEQYLTGGVKNFSPETDIYSLGATLYYLVTGTTPPEAAIIANEGLPTLPDHLSAGVRNCITRAMADKLKLRPHSIAEFMALLNGITHYSDADKTEIITTSKANDKSKVRRHTQTKRKWSWIILLSALVAIALMVIESTIEDKADGGDYVKSAVERQIATTYPTANTQKPKVTPKAEPTTEPETQKSEPQQERQPELTTKVYKYSVTTACGEEAKMEFEYPTAGNPNLIRNIQEWIVEAVAVDYSGEISDGNALLSYCKKIDLADDLGGGSTSINIIYENDKVVTFRYTGWYYAQGALHGSYGVSGATFRKTDGKRLQTDNLNLATYKLQPLIRKKLKQYFEVSTDSELKSKLQLGSPYSIDNIPLPEYNDPIITEDGVEFTYTKSEIAAGVYLPTITFSISEIREYVPAMVAKSFF